MSYSLEELTQQCGIPGRTIRYYIQMGLVDAPRPRGRHTRYEAGSLARLKVIRALRDEGLGLGEIRARLRASGAEQLDTLVPMSPVAAPADPPRTIDPPVAQAIPSKPRPAPSLPPAPVAPSPRRPRPRPVPTAATNPPLAVRADRWARTVLVPGLEIHVREGSGPLVDRLALEIVTAYSLPSHRGS